MSTPIRVGINGFGRIGRKITRLALNNDNIDIVAINDPSPIEALAHLLKYDSVHGTLSGDVSIDGHHLIVSGKKIRVFNDRDPAKLAWADVKAQVVHECTGAFTEREKASVHFGQSTVKKIIVSAPAKGEDATICMGVNEKIYQPANHHLLSNASCTTNCLAPVAKVLDDKFGIVRGTMTTIHSYTNDQKILDVPHKDLRRARAAAVSQIPTTTGAAKAVGLVLPHLKGKLDGLSIRVPTPNVSLVDFVVELKAQTTVQEINSTFKTASQGSLKGILGYSEAPLVSSDYNGNTLSSTVDALLTAVIGGNFVKVISWYDNESGFSQRMIDLTLFIGAQGF